MDVCGIQIANKLLSNFDLMKNDKRLKIPNSLSVFMADKHARRHDLTSAESSTLIQVLSRDHTGWLVTYMGKIEFILTPMAETRK